MFSTLKGYLLAGVGVIAAVFGAVFAYRGKKIDSLEKDVETERENRKEVERVIAQQKQAREVERRQREIEKEIYNSSSSDVDKRLSRFTRD